MTGKKGVEQHRWTDAERARLAEIAHGRGYAEIRDIMTAEFGDHFGGKRIPSALKRYGIKTGRTGRFEKGQEPANKGRPWAEWMSAEGAQASRRTQFKAGQVHGYAAIREQPIGAERVDEDGYVWVKVADGLQERPNCNFRPKHHVVYEQHHGPIPEGHNVVFADRDKGNFDPSNLVAVPKSLMAVVNRAGLDYWDVESLNLAVARAELMHAVREKAPYVPRVCAVCGREFVPCERYRKYTNMPKTCPSCLAMRRRAKREPKRTWRKVCAVCHAEYEAERKNQKRCPSCIERYPLGSVEQQRRKEKRS